MRHTTDFFGLLAYLTLMYGGLPDRDLLRAAYTTLPNEESERPRLELVASRAGQPIREEGPADRKSAAA